MAKKKIKSEWSLEQRETYKGHLETLQIHNPDVALIIDVTEEEADWIKPKFKSVTV